MCWCDLKPKRDHFQIADTDFPLSTFQIADVAAVQPKMDGHVCLSPAAFLPQAADALPEALANVVFYTGHPSIIAVVFNRLIGYQLQAGFMGDFGIAFFASFIPAWLVFSLINWWAKRDGSGAKGALLWAAWIASVLLFSMNLWNSRDIIKAVAFGLAWPWILYAVKKKRLQGESSATRP